jgi:DNA-binding NarL/FixJ family response regulator
MKKKDSIMEEIKVLIVDDNEVVREGIDALLSPHNDIKVIGKAVDGLDAITKAESLEPDVILMDAHMPRASGAEATRRIKEKQPDVKIIFLTVYGEYAGEALDAGASRTCCKQSGHWQRANGQKKNGVHPDRACLSMSTSRAT